jgi:hypothetical protein
MLFYFVFLLEMIIKMAGLGFKSYFKDMMNVYDFIIVVLSSIDFGIFLVHLVSPDQPTSTTGSVIERLGTVTQVFRIFRLLRVIKLAKSWHSLNYFLSTIGNAISKMGSFTLVLYLFMFTYTILGMEMYA